MEVAHEPLVPRGETDCDELSDVAPVVSELTLGVNVSKDALLSRLVQLSALGQHPVNSNPQLVRLFEEKTSTECRYAYKHPTQDLVGAGCVRLEASGKLVTHIHSIEGARVLGCTWIEDRIEVRPTECVWHQGVRLRASGPLSRRVTGLSSRLDRRERLSVMKRIVREIEGAQRIRTKSQ